MNSKLPIGSVIRIKDKKDRYIIIGNEVEKDGKTYDYMCVIYPYGYVESKECVYFDNEEIDTLCFLGDIND